MRRSEPSQSWEMEELTEPDIKEMELIATELPSINPHSQSEATDDDDADFGFLLEYDDDRLSSVIRAA